MNMKKMVSKQELVYRTSLLLKKAVKRFLQSVETGSQTTRHILSVSILSITGTSLVLAFIASVWFTLLVLSLNLERRLLGSWWTQVHLQTCQAALRPVDCVLRAMIHL